MKLYFVDHNYQYAVEQMLLTLFPDERPEYPARLPEDGEDYVKLALNRAAPTAVAICRFAAFSASWFSALLFAFTAFALSLRFAAASTKAAPGQPWRSADRAANGCCRPSGPCRAP